MSLLGRREFLIGGAGAAVFGAQAVRAVDEDPELHAPSQHAAYEPWRSWRATRVPSPVMVVHAAILAANAHDTQPWRFQIASDRIDVYADEDRNLGAMDPFRREMHLSLGCALENAVLIARSLGYAADLWTCGGLLQEGGVSDEGRHVASISLRNKQADASPLMAAAALARNTAWVGNAAVESAPRVRGSRAAARQAFDFPPSPGRFQRRIATAHFRIPSGVADTPRGGEPAPKPGVGGDAPEPHRFVTCLPD